ncbi:MAG: hypothetical protein C4533_07020 [Candidatus Omnitrophota bacterium]|jgi:Tfp pilus assembly PilM family ATPase/Tfp pilus assembly protein PilN|nr:MAG: hypothetical protein C4533_07020 [Candidatus Omnitrophota bacterium]
MNSLGIYFGPKFITIVESKGKRVSKIVNIPQSAIVSSNVDEKVPEEVRTVAVFKDELRRNNITASEATLCLPGSDLLIRTFEIPQLPARELKDAIRFESKKYIPLKLEDLVIDSQSKLDKNKRNQVLFVAVRKDVLDKYISVLSQLDIKINSIEYSAFSILRFFKLSKMAYKDTVALVAIDAEEQDEANFVVLDKDFPLFSRDISLYSEQTEVEGAAVDQAQPATGPSRLMDKLSSELRVSLDFYNRKFPNKKISKVFLISPQPYIELETFLKEIGIETQFVDPLKFSGAVLSLGGVKSFGSSLSKSVNSSVKINLMSAKAHKEKVTKIPVALDLQGILKDVKFDARFIFIGIFICIGALFLGVYRSAPLQRELKSIKAMSPQISGIPASASYQELESLKSEYQTKLNVLKKEIIDRRISLTEALDALPRIVPGSVYLRKFSFEKRDDQETHELMLEGVVFPEQGKSDFEVVNNFILGLQSDPVFSSYFKKIEVVSMDTAENMVVGSKEKTTNFIISCK